MSSQDEQIEQRERHLAELERLGVERYPRRFERRHTIASLVDCYGARTREELEAERIDTVTAGRILAIRSFGKANFLVASDGSAKVQIYVRQDAMPALDFQIFQRLDFGDWVGVEGHLFRTKTNEFTIWASRVHFLAKCLLPLPEKWHGLTDVEIRYRQRYLDLIVNPDSRRVFEARSRVVSAVREFMSARGYLEVETPMMQPIAGGATARPFKTYHNALGMDFYLRIAPELYLKRLIVGGMERVYEINRNFRNEGVSTQHNPEFTMLEFYEAYSDFRDLMDMTERLLTQLVERMTGGRQIEYQGRAISFDRWQRWSMKDAVVSYWDRWNQDHNLPPIQEKPTTEILSDYAQLRAFLDRCGLKATDANSLGSALAFLFDVVVQEYLIDPTFIYDFPVELSPLSKTKPDDPTTVERFELFVGGIEIANAYSELNDPVEQHKRFEEQVRNRQHGDEEAHAMDDDYVRALGYGMPPTAGEGIGIDRLVMLLTDSKSIRDVILVPHLRPEHGREEKTDQPSAAAGGQP
jgi:lysyl-tRNA synthetase class 2